MKFLIILIGILLIAKLYKEHKIYFNYYHTVMVPYFSFHNIIVYFKQEIQPRLPGLQKYIGRYQGLISNQKKKVTER